MWVGFRWKVLIETGDQLDLDGEESADGTVTDFSACGSFGPGTDLASDGFESKTSLPMSARPDPSKYDSVGHSQIMVTRAEAHHRS